MPRRIFGAQEVIRLLDAGQAFGCRRGADELPALFDPGAQGGQFRRAAAFAFRIKSRHHAGKPVENIHAGFIERGKLLEEVQGQNAATLPDAQQFDARFFIGKLKLGPFGVIVRLARGLPCRLNGQAGLDGPAQGFPDDFKDVVFQGRIGIGQAAGQFHNGSTPVSDEFARTGNDRLQKKAQQCPPDSPVGGFPWRADDKKELVSGPAVGAPVSTVQNVIACDDPPHRAQQVRQDEHPPGAFTEFTGRQVGAGQGVEIGDGRRIPGRDDGLRVQKRQQAEGFFVGDGLEPFGKGCVVGGIFGKCRPYRCAGGKFGDQRRQTRQWTHIRRQGFCWRQGEVRQRARQHGQCHGAAHEGRAVAFGFRELFPESAQLFRDFRRGGLLEIAEQLRPDLIGRGVRRFGVEAGQIERGERHEEPLVRSHDDVGPG